MAPAAPGRAAVRLPVYCRVTGFVRPVSGSQIGFEAWLPLSGDWTGRLQMFGNGGYSSDLPFGQMAQGLARGSVVVATDTGHKGDDPDFAVGHKQAIADWGYRAVHETVIEAKRLTMRLYRRRAAHAYFNGCSTGGHQALMEAQRFPGDFDGIVAGAPGADRVRLNAAFLWQFLSNHRPGDDLHPILGPQDLALLQRASFLACHDSNGGSAGGDRSDPWLDDPTQCRFDPATLACPQGVGSGCLSPEQVIAARRMYTGASAGSTNRIVTTPWLPGSEKGWAAYWADPRNLTQPARANFWRIWAFGDPHWDWWRFSYDRDLPAAMRKLGPLVDATDPDLRRYRRRGGKLLQYHGLADPVVSPIDSIRYFGRVEAVTGTGSTANWYRLFLVPGMGHCAGGEGFWRFDVQPAIEAWVETGSPPNSIEAAGSAGQGTRLLCPYPAKATSTGTGYACTMPDRRHQAP
ncbi:MAG: tannase/feruloyl esterase family alpha/beta hydrolase [Sphingomonas sp.]|nr:tannase/feruloyl esterase family alpha/beta hydrolase [Sphingomonas sp.]